MSQVISCAPRYSDVGQQKLDGATYTPFALAKFVARQMVQAANLPDDGDIRVLDPAVGDGALLYALIQELPVAARSRLCVIGYDTDSRALSEARLRLSEAFPGVRISLFQTNFLEHILSLQGSGDLLSAGTVELPFDLVIANPPYVRTQVLGAAQAKLLAQCFGLTGRVDLYYPFLLGISRILSETGIAGIITSNRFMTTKSGQAVRRELLARFRVCHVWDFGDTKLFDAAVLPSVILARGIPHGVRNGEMTIGYSSIYETDAETANKALDVTEALAAQNDTVVAIPDGRRFHVRHGTLDHSGGNDAVWRIATQSSDKWLTTVERHTWGTFRRIGKIKVGVKSTADKVFIRSDWDQLPNGRPELLRSLITRHSARRFKADDKNSDKKPKEILYPHEATETGRAAVDLAKFPVASCYLEQHRHALESRSYVIESGRKWYELWVPHDPAAWSEPKLVFPDISEKPIFWIDTEGGVVNGECYWLKCDNPSEQDLLWLALAVANSTFIEAFYDHRFNNKLYAGRRRYITQYVEQFPLPDPNDDASKSAVALAKRIYSETPSQLAAELSSKLDALIWEIFGLPNKEV